MTHNFKLSHFFSDAAIFYQSAIKRHRPHGPLPKFRSGCATSADRLTAVLSKCYACAQPLLNFDSGSVNWHALGLFLKIYNTTVLCIVESTGHLLSADILLAVREWQQEGMGITNGNNTRLNLGLVMVMGMKHWEWEGMGLKKTLRLISSIIWLCLRNTLTYLLTFSSHCGSWAGDSQANTR